MPCELIAFALCTDILDRIVNLGTGFRNCILSLCAVAAIRIIIILVPVLILLHTRAYSPLILVYFLIAAGYIFTEIRSFDGKVAYARGAKREFKDQYLSVPEDYGLYSLR